MTDESITISLFQFNKMCEEIEELRAYKKQQQPCEDCISRQAVNTLVDELARAISDERCHMPRGRATGAIMWDIINLPPVTPKEKTGWIPVTDRLPDKNGSYLCTTRNTVISVRGFTNDLNKLDKYDFRNETDNYGFYDYDSEWGYYKVDVIAWMPLPKPYKEVSE